MILDSDTAPTSEKSQLTFRAFSHARPFPNLQNFDIGDAARLEMLRFPDIAHRTIGRRIFLHMHTAILLPYQTEMASVFVTSTIGCGTVPKDMVEGTAAADGTWLYLKLPEELQNSPVVGFL